MPTCNRCDHLAASADMRRSPKGGHLCNDKTACERRRLASLSDWHAIHSLADEVRLVALDVEGATGRADVMTAMRKLRIMADHYSNLAVELAQAAAREGKTQKAIADTLGVPASTLRGLKASAA